MILHFISSQTKAPLYIFADAIAMVASTGIQGECAIKLRDGRDFFVLQTPEGVIAELVKQNGSPVVTFAPIG